MDANTRNTETSLADLLDGKKRALRVDEVAELLAISPRQVYKLAAENRIAGCFKIGGSIRFDPVAIAMWLRQKMASASLEPEWKRKKGA